MTELPPPFVIGEQRLTLNAFAAVCAGTRAVRLGAGARARVESSLALRRRLEQGEARVYGINTGFGRLADTVIPAPQRAELQANLVRSHAVGWGPALSREEARGVVFLRALSLARGCSGVRPEVIEQLLWVLADDRRPFLPSRGSVGASGDLAPLAHLALALMGEGWFLSPDGAREPAAAVLARARRAPLALEAKEGLALINGTQLMTSLGLLAVARAERLLGWAALAAALSVEALEGSTAPFGAAYHAWRPHPGVQAAAAALAQLLAGSELLAAHGDCPRVQDPYSVRCAPQVLGASLAAVRQARAVLLREAESVTDNPLLDPESGAAVSGGHFHGQPIALPLDGLNLALCEVGSVAERRIALALGGNGGRLPRFLAGAPGLESGLMIAQYLAAALASENKTGAFPASADSIPTSDGQEDHVSMGSVAALRLRPLLERVEAIVALELLTAARALRFVVDPALAAAHGRPALSPSPWTARLAAALAARVDLAPGDRPLTLDLEAVLAMLHEEPGPPAAFRAPLAPLAAGEGEA